MTHRLPGEDAICRVNIAKPAQVMGKTDSKSRDSYNNICVTDKGNETQWSKIHFLAIYIQELEFQTPDCMHKHYILSLKQSVLALNSDFLTY